MDLERKPSVRVNEVQFARPDMDQPHIMMDGQIFEERDSDGAYVAFRRTQIVNSSHLDLGHSDHSPEFS
jgi:hypothetical protein